ncbi:MAG: CDP-diacylglycerol--glycerol-3-phosphate 3-phosphatidyltransferase [Desulfovibrionaceae bacterium]|jgi:CDP-diacylglycerol--glycerol-3-phosphate 3-phosphatidyltransferase|nr:CDP-diacylglycerol--glycerol-3-phosphate 3-phosphatidyltransferase [Desulfovibrionaceae bacterium]
MFNLANRITLVRILAAPLLVVLMYFPQSRVACLAAMLVFIAASLTDLLDGRIARKMNMVTNFGKFLDPLADKVLVGTALIMLVDAQRAPAWVAILIVARELMVTGLRAVAADQGLVIAADRFGKLKTILQIVALCPLLLHFPWFGIDPAPIGEILLYIALVMTVFSGINYLYGFYRNWLADEGDV